jgi:DNA replication protein DnaC
MQQLSSTLPPTTPATRSCLRCKGPLDAVRRHVCATCDAYVEVLQQQHQRPDVADALKRRLRSSDLPLDYARGNRGIDAFPPETSVQQAVHSLFRKWIAADASVQPWIYISGDVGTGKTHLACSALKRVIENGSSGLYVNYRRFLLQVRATFSKHDGPSEFELLEALCRTPNLVIDDLGVERRSQHSLATLYSILDQRGQSKLPTIFTSNIATKDLSRHLADDATSEDALRVVDRIRGLALEVRLTGTSYRARGYQGAA